MNYFAKLSMTALLALFCSANSFAETLTVVTGNTVAPGTTGVAVDININDDSNTAGASFTVTYDTTKLTLTNVESNFFGTFASQNISPTSVVVDGVTYQQGLVRNPTTGGTMLAAARTTNGTAGGPQTLFTLTFNVANDASGDYPINIIQSTITNADAGYAAPTQIPMLVGISGDTYPAVEVTAVTAGTLTVGVAVTDTDGDGIDDNWETTQFGNLSTANATSDYDHDGYSDSVESRNGTNPKNQDAAGGTDYNGMTDSREGWAWSQVATGSPENMVDFGNGFALDFGDAGLWILSDGNFTFLNPNNPALLTSVDTDANGSKDLLVIAFNAGVGLYTYDGAVWNHINPNVPEGMTPYLDGVAIDFGSGIGIYRYSITSGWTLLNTGNPTVIESCDSNSDRNVETLAMNFVGYGVYLFDGTTWTFINPNQAQSIKAYRDGFAIDFGSGIGVYAYSLTGGWSLVTSEDPTIMKNLDSDSDGTFESLIMTFAENGVYLYEGSSVPVNIANTQAESFSTNGPLILGDFGTSGLYSYQVSQDVAQKTLLLGFPGLNLYAYDGSWSLINPNVPEEITPFKEGAAIDFGSGIGLYTYSTASGYTKLHDFDPKIIVGCDLDGNGTMETLAVNFAGYGIWLFDGTTWSQFNPNDADKMVAYRDGLAIDFGGSIGMYTFSKTDGYKFLSSSSAERMVSCDLNGDKIYDSLALAYTGAGLNVFNGTNWTYLNPNIPEAMISFGDGLVIDFGGLGLYRWTVGEVNLQPIYKDGVMPNPALLGNGRTVNSLTISLPDSSGTWIYDGTWTQLNPNSVGVVNVID